MRVIDTQALPCLGERCPGSRPGETPLSPKDCTAIAMGASRRYYETDSGRCIGRQILAADALYEAEVAIVEALTAAANEQQIDPET